MLETLKSARSRWLTPVILATQEAEIRRIVIEAKPGKIVHKTVTRKKKIHRKGLVEWLKVQALSSNPSTAKKKQTKKNSS
jgi:hypothetical protein